MTRRSADRRLIRSESNPIRDGLGLTLTMEQLTKRLYERVLGAEMSHYLGHEKGQAPKLEADQQRENHRTGRAKRRS